MFLGESYEKYEDLHLMCWYEIDCLEYLRSVFNEVKRDIII